MVEVLVTLKEETARVGRLVDEVNARILGRALMAFEREFPAEARKVAAIMDKCLKDSSKRRRWLKKVRNA